MPGGGPKPADGGGAPIGGPPIGGPPIGAPGGAPAGGAIGPSMVAWKARFCFCGSGAPGGGPGGMAPGGIAPGMPGWGGPGGAPGAPGGAPGAPGAPGFPAVTPLIIIVPLNFDAAALGLSAVPHATHWVAVSVLGLPQLGQKTVTLGASGPSVPLSRSIQIDRGDLDGRLERRRESTDERVPWEGIC